jgi:hypothetical protein
MIFIPVAETIKSNTITRPLPVSEIMILPNENTIIGIFGCKSPSLNDLKKLKPAKMLLLAAHLAGEMDVEIPAVKKDIMVLCQLNFWRIDNLWEDVREAMAIAHKAFMCRIGEFKRTFKNLLRVANEQ